MIPKSKIEAIIAKHVSIEKELSSGKLEPKLYSKKSKEYSNLGHVITPAKEYLDYEKNKKDLEIIINDKKSNDDEIRNLAKVELEVLNEEKIKNEKILKIFLLPKDLDDQKNAIVEIRAGTGGLEATLFALIFLKCMKKFVQKKNG